MRDGTKHDGVLATRAPVFGEGVAWLGAMNRAPTKCGAGGGTGGGVHDAGL
jgi:hypothetical protein